MKACMVNSPLAATKSWVLADCAYKRTTQAV
jgi:hypothetical protein